MRLIAISVIQILLPICLFAGNNCTTSSASWNQNQAKAIVNESAWSKKMTLAVIPKNSSLNQAALELPSGGADPRLAVDPPRGYGADKGSGVYGEKELYYSYSVRLFSALPVRRAYVRLVQLRDKYDRMSLQDKSSYDKRFDPVLSLDTSEEIIVAVDLQSNDRQLAMEVFRQLNQATRNSLSQYAYLITDHRGRIPLKDYAPPSADGTGAKLIFPRNINGEPVVLSQDKELKLEFVVPGTSRPDDIDCTGCHKVYIVWKVKDLLCDGQLLL